MSLYYKLLPLANKVSGAMAGLAPTISSILRMMLCSKTSISRRSGEYYKLKLHEDCTILANGPSLKTAMEKGEVRLDGVDVCCVNYFCESEYFWQIKPRFYFLIDPQLFNPTTELNVKQVPDLIDALNKADWDIFVCIPSHALNGGVMNGVSNPHVRFIRFNTTTCNGWKWFKYKMYDWRLGMPQCINVVNFCIMAAIVMKRKNIYLYGIDHTFSAHLFVDDDNCVCHRESHVYADEDKIYKHPDSTISRNLATIAHAFAIHEQLAEYSKHVGVRIYNCTRGSFVDAYERLYPKE